MSKETDTFLAYRAEMKRESDEFADKVVAEIEQQRERDRRERAEEEKKRPLPQQYMRGR